MGKAKESDVEGQSRFQIVRFVHNPFTGWAVLGLSLLLTASATFVAKNQLEERAVERFQVRVGEISDAIRERFALYEQALHGTRGLFNASNYVDRQEFKSYVDSLNIDTRLPGIQGIGYSIPLEPNALGEHISSIRQEGFSDYVVKPEGEREQYSAIIYLEPFDWRNQRAFGYDMWSNEMRRLAMKRAKEEGLTSTSGLITLVQETEEDVQRGFLTYVPVYKSGETPNTIEARKAEFQGWVYAAFRANNFMRGIRVAADEKVAYQIYDGKALAPSAKLFDSVELSSNKSEMTASDPLEYVDTLELQGRSWTIHYRGSKSQMLQAGEMSDPVYVLIAGVVVNTLLFYVLISLRHLNRETRKSAQEIEFKYKQSLNNLLEKEESINNAKQQASLFFDLAPVAFVVVNKQGNIVNVNERAKELFGYEKNELIDQNVDVLIPQDLILKHIARREKDTKVATGETMVAGGAIKAQRKDGTSFLSQINLVNTISDGEVNIIASVRDVSEQAEFEQALKDAKEFAEKSSKAKSDFVANMSHEIRTPLNAVLGSAQLLERTKLNDVQNKYIGMIRGAGEALLGIINDILDFSKIESGNLELAPVEFDLDDILSRVSMMMSVNAADENLHLIVLIDEDLPNNYIGDSLRIQQVLINLIANAIKFTEHGEVILAIRLVSRTSDEVTLHFSVSDTGIGITEAQRKNLFKAFSQADTSITRQFGGTGLGLTISSKLVKLMGDEIYVKSEEGKGSEFGFQISLPLAGDAVPARAPIDKAYKVVVIEKHALARQAINAIIKRWKWPCEAYESFSALTSHNPEALKTCQLLIFNESICESGCESTFRQISDLALPKESNILVVRSHSAGGAGALQNPYYEKVGQLNSPVVGASIIQELLIIEGFKRKTESENNGLDLTKLSLEGIRFLLVEDNPLNQQIVQDFLEDTKVELDIANNGQEALDKVSQSEHPYDIIFMDIQMPIMDGVTATKRLRSSEFNISGPIIAMTAGVLSSEQQSYLDAGMTDFIPKPIEHDVFFSAIARHLPESFVEKLKRSNPSALPRHESDMVGEERDKTPRIFDVSRLDGLTRGKPERIKRIAQSLSNLCASSIEDFDGGVKKLKDGDKESALFAFHGLKGVIANYGGKDASEQLQQFENKIKSDTPYAELQPMIDVTRTSIELYLNAVKHWIDQHSGGI